MRDPIILGPQKAFLNFGNSHLVGSLCFGPLPSYPHCLNRQRLEDQLVVVVCEVGRIVVAAPLVNVGIHQVPEQISRPQLSHGQNS